MLSFKPKLRAPVMPPVKIQKDAVFLRPPTEKDCAQWILVRARNEKRLKPLEPLWPKDCLEEDFFFKRLEKQAREWRLDQAYPLLIFEKTTRKLIGGININHVSRGAAQFASLGYWIDQEAEGKGLMSAAMRGAFKFAFRDLKLHRLNAATLPENTRSKNLLVRNGFKQEGFAEKYIRINGVWQDHVLFGLPIETWLEQDENNTGP